MPYLPDLTTVLVDGARFTQGGVEYVIKGHPAGMVTLPSGQLVGCDPLIAPETAAPFTVTVEPGRYRLAAWVAAVHQSGSEPQDRTAALQLVVKDQPTVRWEPPRLASRPERRPPTPGGRRSRTGTESDRLVNHDQEAEHGGPEAGVASRRRPLGFRLPRQSTARIGLPPSRCGSSRRRPRPAGQGGQPALPGDEGCGGRGRRAAPPALSNHCRPRIDCFRPAAPRQPHSVAVERLQR